MKKACFCYADKIFEWPPVASASIEGIKYYAFCERQPYPHNNYFDDMTFHMVGPPPHVINPRNFDSRTSLRVERNEKSGSEIFYVILSGKTHLAAETSDDSLTYLAFGDCKFGNLGHCMGDLSAFYIVRQLLGYSKEQTRAILFKGFGGHAYKERAKKSKIRGEIVRESMKT